MSGCFSAAQIARFASELGDSDRDDVRVHGRDNAVDAADLRVHGVDVAVEIDAIAAIDLDPHFGECLTCRRKLDADRRARAMLGALPTPSLTSDHRRALAAELLARAQLAPLRVRRRWIVPVALAAAAGLVFVASRLAGTVATPEAPTIAHESPTVAEELAPSVQAHAHEPPAPVLPPPRIEASGGATLSHQFGIDRDVLTLVDGIIEIDTRDSRNVDVRVGNATIRIDDASVKIRASKHAIVSVQVVVGAAQISAPDQQVTLERDSIWMPGPSRSAQSLTAFRDGWIALRAGKNTEAMELFDRVTDPVVAEEAAYWAAVAAHRSGDASAAKSHEDSFLKRYPQSEFAPALRAK